MTELSKDNSGESWFAKIYESFSPSRTKSATDWRLLLRQEIGISQEVLPVGDHQETHLQEAHQLKQLEHYRSN